MNSVYLSTRFSSNFNNPATFCFGVSGHLNTAILVVKRFFRFAAFRGISLLHLARPRINSSAVVQIFKGGSAPDLSSIAQLRCVVKDFFTAEQLFFSRPAMKGNMPRIPSAVKRPDQTYSFFFGSGFLSRPIYTGATSW